MREHLTGQFTPGTSILHRLDARAKFFGFLILIAATVCTDAWLGYALLLAVTAAIVAVCGLPLRTALASVARMGWFFLLIFVMNALFFATDDAIWHWWILTLSVPGIVQGAQVTVRLALILVMSNVLTCTTPPLEITGAIQTLLSPLRLVRLPVEDIAMILSSPCSSSRRCSKRPTPSVRRRSRAARALKAAACTSAHRPCCR